MSIRQLYDVMRHFRSSAAGTAGELTDEELLLRFSLDQDETAFAALMQRHGTMVLGVCRRVLRDPNDADDAFQAAFLVLARKAGSINQPDRLASWLYRVAIRVAQKARAKVAQRQALLQQVMDMPAPQPDREADWNDVRQILDEEVQRLPEKFRLPILLCYLEGKTREETAEQLGWSAGAVKGMLERGRELLRSRLTRRGVPLPATSLAGLLSETTLSAAVPAALSDSTIKAALLIAAGNAAAGSPAALAEGVLQAMGISRRKVAVAVMLALTVAGTTAGVVAFGIHHAEPEAPKKAEPAPKKDKEEEPLGKRAASRLDLAKDAFELSLMRFQFALEPEEMVNLWSRRWLQAQLDLSARKADRDAALLAHQDRLKKVDEIARARLDLGIYSPPKKEVELGGEPKHREDILKEKFESAWKDYMHCKVSPEQVCNASVRWLIGQQQVRPRGKEVPQADPKDLQAHLDRVKKLEAIVQARVEEGLESKLDSDTVLFHRVQADEWWAQKKTFPEEVLNPGSELLKK